MEMNIEKMDLNELIDLREKLSDAIEKAKEEKYRDIETGDVYTRSNADGSKVVYLVLDENDSERVKYLYFCFDTNGLLRFQRERSDEWMKFVEYVHDADVKHGCFEPYEYEDEVDKLRLDFYRKVTN